MKSYTGKSGGIMYDSTMPRSYSSSDTYGNCEYCCRYSPALCLVEADDAFYNQENNPIRQNYFRGPIAVCNKCRYDRAGRFRNAPTWIAKNYMKASNLFKDDTELEIANVFLDLRKSVKVIGDIFLVPESFVPDDCKDSVNICIDIPRFSTLSYTTWALREVKSVMNLWGTERERNKFWQSHITRLLIALGRMSSETPMLNIWLLGYGRRIFHIDHFVRPPDATSTRKVVVSKLIKLDK
jgi:hypothetical protein